MRNKGSSRRISQKECRIIQDRLRDLGYLEDAVLPANVPLTFDSPPLDIPRPTYRTAAVQGRIHLRNVELLVDSGSSISVVGLDFAQKHLRRCKRTAYHGGTITVADNNSVAPLGIIYAEIEVGPSYQYRYYWEQTGSRRVVQLQIGRNKRCLSTDLTNMSTV